MKSETVPLSAFLVNAKPKKKKQASKEEVKAVSDSSTPFTPIEKAEMEAQIERIHKRRLIDGQNPQVYLVC